MELHTADRFVRSDVAREFAMGWPVLAGSMLGIAVGVAAIPAPAIGVFMRALQAEFGWTRTQISLGPTILVAVVAVGSPFLGWLADRVRTVWLCVAGLCGLTISLLLFSRLGPDVRLYYAAFAALALASLGSATVPYARALSENFVRARGLVLGLAMIGTGVASILLPLLLSPYVARVGWRQSYVVLAIVVALATPVVGVLMARARSVTSARSPRREVRGTSFEAALRDRTFWTLALCFTLVPLAAGGLFLHMLSFLADAGVDPKKAGAIASLGGAFIIVCRVLTGWLVDHIFAPLVAAMAMAGSAICIAILAHFGAPAATLGALAIGLTMGAEFDLIGYMTARYFGMRAYGRIYGLFYTVALAGSSLSAVFYGAVFDATKNYSTAFYTGAAILIFSALLFLTLRRFDDVEK